MKINAPKEKYIFIELNKNDMKRLNLSYDDMDYSDEETRKTIFSVLNQAKCSLGQNFEISDTLRVEALPRDDGGCLLFFTIGNKTVRYRLSSKKGEVIYLFDGINEFLDLAFSVNKKLRGKIETSLYLISGRYYLKIRGALHHSLIALMNEYAQYVPKQEAPTLSENECVIEKTALEIL